MTARNQASAWAELENALDCLSPLDRQSFQDGKLCRGLFSKGPGVTVLSRFAGYLGHFDELRDVPEDVLSEALRCVACSCS